MFRFSVLVGATSSIVGLAACALKPIDYNPWANDDVRTIGILRVESPEVYDYQSDWRSMRIGGAATGELLTATFLAALVAPFEASVKAAQSGRDEKIDSHLDAEGFDFGAQLTAALERELKHVGFQTIVIESDRRKDDRLLREYKSLPELGSVDAVLDIAPTFVGCYQPKSDFEPCVTVHVRLFDVRDSEVLYQQDWATHADRPREQMILVHDKHVEPSWNETLADDSTLGAGLEIVVDSLAHDIARVLYPVRRSPQLAGGDD